MKIHSRPPQTHHKPQKSPTCPIRRSYSMKYSDSQDIYFVPQLGNTLVFLFYLIGRDSKVQKRLYEETATLAPPGCDISSEDLRNAKYLRACITEAFRVIPTVPCIARILDESIKLSDHNLDAGVSYESLHSSIRDFDDHTESFHRAWE